MTQYGLLPPQSGYGLLGYDEKQARLDAFLNGLGNTSAALLAAGAPSTDPGNFGRNMAKIGPGFAQGFQGSMQNSRNRAFENTQMAEMQRKRQQEEQAALARERLATARTMGGKDMAGQPVNTEALFAQGYPEQYGKVLAAGMKPGNAADNSAPVKNYIYRVGLVKDFGEGSPQVRQFDEYVRANKYLDLGDRFIQPNPANPTVPVAEYGKGLGPERVVKDGQAVTLPAAPAGQAPSGIRQAGGMPEAAVSAVPLPETPKQKEEKLQVALTQSRKISSQLDRLEGLRKTVGELKEKAGSWFTGGLTGQLAQASAGSEQYAMNVKTREIQSIIGLDNLVSIKEQGGTFGALSEKELDLLIAKAGSLDPLLESFPDDLDQVMTLYEKGLAGQIEDFYAVNKNARPDWAKRPIVKTLGVRVEKPAENSIQEVRGDGNMQDENQKAIDAWKLNNPFPTD